jgi:hypothetical protein
MGEREKKDEQQAEDLEVEQKDAEDVKGGFSWGATQQGSFGAKANMGPGLLTEEEMQHNEILIRI